MNEEYALDEMLQWLKKHFEQQGYKVKYYSEDLKPARVPLYCIKEVKIKFDLSKIPGDDERPLKEFLVTYPDFSFVKNAKTEKSKDGKTIRFFNGKKSVALTIEERKVFIKSDSGKTLDIMAEKQKDELYIFDEVVIECTTDKIISKSDFFHDLPIKKVTIPESSPVRFYQYYFPKAKIFYAIPDYVKETKKFNEFKDVCEKRGIGILNTSPKKIKEIVKSRPLFDEICTKIINNKEEDERIEKIIGDHMEDFLHHLVYYPAPIYKRRSIIGAVKGKISLRLIDKLPEINNIIYKDVLHDLSSNFRDLAKDDYEIADRCITRLWKNYLGLKFPIIQRRVENILQREEKYRDHFVHQFQVFLIGAYILDKIYSDIADDFEEKYACKIENVWLAASTFHDFSYGLQNFDTWLLQFFEDILLVKNSQTKENLNLLNLDAAMIREALLEKVIKIVEQLAKTEGKHKEEMVRFFYEKVVRDRNHGVLSAISLLKLYNEADESSLKINDAGILQAAISIGCHDEDIWEALCGCQGYRSSRYSLPKEEVECIKRCNRELEGWDSKRSRIYKEKIDKKVSDVKLKDYKCEDWEREIMKKRVIKKIEFKKNPILFILILCDSVQDEGRVNSSGEHVSGDRSSLKDVEIKEDNGKTVIIIKLQSDQESKKYEEIERIEKCVQGNNKFKININDLDPVVL